ncbi:MAG: histidinol dehydrogenase, partial [Oscillospiraceae bacterium]|nr:histidinol dehydrogenase [Oscillospiraceae bacterium]
MIKIIKLNEIRESNITLETTAKSITSTVAEIIADVIKRGDKAVHEYTKRFDKCDISEFELSESEIENAIKNVDYEFIKIMERAARNIEDYHRNQIRTGFETKFEDKGIVLGQKIIPIEKVCCYIPGGTAPYPSSVLMNCIPAKIAGVNQMFITTPPSPTGVDARILAAAKIAGVDKVFTIGGAQAIAAFAFGTETIPQVSKITGPGNAYVAEAKRQVFGVVGIDMLAGPSDILIIADKNANPIYVAADMLSQCEHGTDSPA